LNITLENLIAFGFIILSAIALAYLTRALKAEQSISLRKLPAFETLQKLVAKTVADGSTVHLSPGRGGLEGSSNPATLAALSALDSIVRDASTGNNAPLVTTGAGTLYIASNDMLRGAADDAVVPGLNVSDSVQFLAAENSPLAFGAGVNQVLDAEHHGGSFISGKLGLELAYMTEAADRKRISQVLGSDDLEALAIATAASEDVLVGEELYAAAAYMTQEPSRLASLQLQDLVRIIVAIAVLVAAVVSLFLT